MKSGLPDGDPRHGTLNGYRNHDCRCAACKAEGTIAIRKLREKRQAALLADPTLRPHGKRDTYENWGCRCEDCRASRRVAAKRKDTP